MITVYSSFESIFYLHYNDCHIIMNHKLIIVDNLKWNQDLLIVRGVKLVLSPLLPWNVLSLTVMCFNNVLFRSRSVLVLTLVHLFSLKSSFSSSASFVSSPQHTFTHHQQMWCITMDSSSSDAFAFSFDKPCRSYQSDIVYRAVTAIWM